MEEFNLGEQALNLISTTSQFEADRSRVQIEMSMSRESLSRIKEEYQARSKSLSGWVESKSAEPEIELLRNEIAAIEIQKTRALSVNNSGTDNSSLISGYDKKLVNLNAKLNQLTSKISRKIVVFNSN